MTLRQVPCPLSSAVSLLADSPLLGIDSTTDTAVDPNCGRCEKRYHRRYYSFAVPTTVPPTLAGAAGFALLR